jgi:endo-beta-N-acetylglucosaminidase D
VIEEGHDVEHWGGFFGSRFKKDQFWVVGYNRDNDWVARYKTNFPQGVQLPYTTFYNLGHGKSFYFKGKEVKRLYDFLSDNDPCYTYIMNPPLNVSICHTDAYIGGTSLLVENTQKLKLIEI